MTAVAPAAVQAVLAELPADGRLVPLPAVCGLIAPAAAAVDAAVEAAAAETAAQREGGMWWAARLAHDCVAVLPDTVTARVGTDVWIERHTPSCIMLCADPLLARVRDGWEGHPDHVEDQRQCVALMVTRTVVHLHAASGHVTHDVDSSGPVYSAYRAATAAGEAS